MVWRAGCLSQDCMCKSNSIVDVTQPFVFVPKCLPTYLSLELEESASSGRSGAIILSAAIRNALDRAPQN